MTNIFVPVTKDMSDVAKEKAVRLLKMRESVSSLGSQEVRAKRDELTVKTKE